MSCGSTLAVWLSALCFVLVTSDVKTTIAAVDGGARECSGRLLLTAKSCAGDGIDHEERKLYNLINSYRSRQGLPSIPISPSLSLVANRHVRDLEHNIRQLTHGWSDCRYSASDDRTYPCMWKAPQRLGTAYKGFGYENAHGGTGSYRATAESALRSWMSSSEHNAIMLNQGIWRTNRWKALGVGIYGKYAVIWFGEETDPAAAPQREKERQRAGR
jgi:hypothetical protein